MYCIVFICNSVLQQGMEIYNCTDWLQILQFLVEGSALNGELQMLALSHCLWVGLS